MLKQVYKRIVGVRGTNNNLSFQRKNMNNLSMASFNQRQGGMNNLINKMPTNGFNMGNPMMGSNIPPMMGNIPQMLGSNGMPIMNPLNANNSQLFNNIGTLNNSINDVNMNLPPGQFNVNMMNNNNSQGKFGSTPNQDFNNLNMPLPPMAQNLNNFNTNMMFNPNINNIMANPNSQNFPVPAYNLPNMYMKNEPDELNYDGDIIRMVEQLRSLERNVQSFVDVKLVYYDQKLNLRTDSIDGVHPDYNYKMNFEIKPNQENEFFTKEELHKSNGGLYFTLYDEVRTEDIIQEKEANTYIYKYEKKYLGSLFLPFSTIFQNASLLETVSKINVPMTVFGYYSDTSTAFDVQNKKEEDMRRQNNFAQMNLGNLPNMNASQNSFFNKEGNFFFKIYFFRFSKNN